jgi:serine protease
MQCFKLIVRYILLGSISFLASCGDGGGGGGGIVAELDPFLPGGKFTLSGKIVVPAVATVDSDTNDLNAPFASNDTPNEASTIGNPITLGGYVNVAGTGEPGRSQVAGDRDDYYRVELLAGQVVTLLVSDFQTADADLYLYDSSGQNIVDFSVGVDQIESLTVAADGVYFVNPYAFSGASNYVLVIGNIQITSVGGGLRLSDDFVSGQAVVRYDTSLSQRQALSGQNQSFSSIASRSGFRISAGAPDREMLLELDAAVLPLAAKTSQPTPADTKVQSFRNAEDRAKWETLMAIKALRKDSFIKYAEPNYILKASAIPNDEFYVLQWHYPLINLPAAWDLETGNANVIVAVIDTGVLLNHPDLQGQLVAGYDFISGAISGDGDGIDANPDDPGDGGGSQPSSFHGTHVAGTIAAATNNSRGIAGIAWGAKIMPLRVLGIGGGTSYDIRQAVLFAAGLANDSGGVPAQRADIINLSLGGGSFSQLDQDVYTAARNAGVIIVAAAGNEETAMLSYPASYSGVISVSAVDPEHQLAYYSNFGTTIDIAAPGGDARSDRDGDGYPDGVLSTSGDDSSGSISFNYIFQQGTSMAAPHVAGVIALMKSANSNITPDIIDQQLIAGNLTDDIGTPGRDNSFGYGLLNAQKAVTAALTLGGSPPPDNPMLGVTPMSLNFDTVTTVIEITTQNTSSGNLQLTSISANQPWITVTPVSIDGNSLGTYRVTVDRSSLADGIYSGEITAQSSVNTVNIPVFVSVNTTGASGDVGYIYVLLIDTDTGTSIDEISPPAVSGTYSFTFSNVPAGTYEILAGTDSDNDFFICDPGEACGIYPSIDQPIQLDVSADESNLDFPIGYIVALPSLNRNGNEGIEPDRDISRRAIKPSNAIAR